MQRIKEEPVDADAIQSSSQEQYPIYLGDNEIMQENNLEPEIGVDTSFKIVSVCSTRDANGWSDHGGLHEWSADSSSHQGKEHQVPSNKLISDHPRPFHVDTNSGIQAMERAQNLSLQECVKFQSIRRRYKPQMLQMQRRFTEDSIFIRPSKRRCTTTPRKFREVCKDIICLPADYPEHNCTYSVPRGNQREQLAMLGLVGKISIQSSCSFENFRRKVMTLFQKCFSCSEEEFSFDFLQCLPGNRKLVKPKVSATFKWSGTAIISLAAQGSLYIKTPHTLTESPKNLFFNTKQHPVPEVKSENLDEKFSLGQRSVEPGDPHLMGSLCQVEEKDHQRCGIADFGAPQEHTPARDPSDEKQPNTGKRLAEKLDQGATEKMPTGSIPQEIPTIQYHDDGKSFNMTNNSVFKLLRNAGMKTAHVKTFSQKRLVTSGCETIPIAWGCWRIATGAYLRRHPGTKGRRLYLPRVEVFYMADDVSEQVCSDEQLQALKLICAGVTIGQCEIDILNRTVVAMFEILEKACSASDFILVNIKVQFGVDVESTEIVLADVIEYNCWHRSQLGNWNPQDDKQKVLRPTDHGRVVVLMESESYLVHCEKIKASCAKFSIPCELRVSSAYTGPGDILDIKSQYEGDGAPTVFITVAGRSNGLASVLSANTPYPVINCPAVSAEWSAHDVLSAVTAPEDFGFCTVLSPEAAAQFSAHILGLNNHQLWSKLRSCALNKWICVKQADEALKARST